ncbi:magnesium transporter [Marinobacter segnicrescens]|uniref:Magnesium transporter MgtE n=1 Tax=Marinobacter segnicrescens TaxID=430453 RepID=A0A1I0DXD6_9GAMM|nr:MULTISPECIES: magnesium transporter [Marinobacter]UZD66637.1 magnesium transporter [Marinobacter sp. AN1]SET36535.1 magnesium transporter [Marinobacter segnicrescens]
MAFLDSDFFQPLDSALVSGDPEAIRAAAAAFNAADLAEFIEHTHDEDGRHGLKLLQSLPMELQAKVFGYIGPDMQRVFARLIPNRELAGIVTDMSADERADFFNLLDENQQHALFQSLASREREDLRRLASFEEGTAGALMTSDYAVVSSGMTVASALALLRNTAPDKETIYQAYVVDQDHRLIGVISLRNLITSAPGAMVDGLMATGLVSAHTHTEQEEVARLISRYDLLALPIVDDDERLVGIVTYDDAMDVAEAEATEDMHKGATVGRLETGLKTASPFSLYRSRVQWLVILVFANIFTGASIDHFQQTISSHIALLFFMPLLIASGGNAGAQSATLMVRGLATGDVTAKDWGMLLGKDILVATGLGLTMAAAVTVVGVVKAGPDIATVVAISMLIVVLMGSIIGMLLPFLLDKLQFDPATASMPLITTIADVSGVLIYFTVASVVLGL